MDVRISAAIITRWLVINCSHSPAPRCAAAGCWLRWPRQQQEYYLSSHQPGDLYPARNINWVGGTYIIIATVSTLELGLIWIWTVCVGLSVFCVVPRSCLAFRGCFHCSCVNSSLYSSSRCLHGISTLAAKDVFSSIIVNKVKLLYTCLVVCLGFNQRLIFI